MEKLRALNFHLQSLLWEEILGIKSPANVAAVPAPTPEAPPPTQTSPRDSVDRAEKEPSSNSAAEEECLSPIYRRTGVTLMAFMKEQLQVPYTDEAAQNKVEGKIVLQFVVCSNGRVSDISIDEQLSFGLTERAIEAIRKVRFQPALLGTQPVSVMTKQTFSCAQQVCTALSP